MMNDEQPMSRQQRRAIDRATAKELNRAKTVIGSSVADDAADFERTWQTKIDEVVDKFYYLYSDVISRDAIYQIVHEGIELGVAINEDAARRATIQVRKAQGN